MNVDEWQRLVEMGALGTVELLSGVGVHEKHPLALSSSAVRAAHEVGIEMDACPTCGCHEEPELGRVRAQGKPRRAVEDLREESPERPSRAEFFERGRMLVGEYEAHYGRITEGELTSFMRLAVVELQEQDGPWPDEESPERPSRAEFVERGRELVGEYEAHYGRITEGELASFVRLAVVELQEQDGPWPEE